MTKGYCNNDIRIRGTFAHLITQAVRHRCRKHRRKSVLTGQISPMLRQHDLLSGKGQPWTERVGCADQKGTSNGKKCIPDSTCAAASTGESAILCCGNCCESKGKFPATSLYCNPLQLCYSKWLLCAVGAEGQVEQKPW